MDKELLGQQKKRNKEMVLGGQQLKLTGTRPIQELPVKGVNREAAGRSSIDESLCDWRLRHLPVTPFILFSLSWCAKTHNIVAAKRWPLGQSWHQEKEKKAANAHQSAHSKFP